MIKPTFYIAASLEDKDAVDRLASWLVSRGYEWSLQQDWTKHQPDAEDHAQRSLWAVRDISAAVTADVFILLLGDRPTPGAHCELGARYAVSKPIFGIRGGPDSHHLFHDLPVIEWFVSVEDFILSMFGA